MIVNRSRPAFRVFAMLAVSTIALGAPVALAATATDLSGKYSVLPRAQSRYFDCTCVPRPSEVHEHVQDRLHRCCWADNPSSWKAQDAHRPQAKSLVRSISV